EEDAERSQAAAARDRQPADPGEPAGRRPAGRASFGHDTFFRTSEALVPPKPKLLESAMSIFIGLALCGTRSIGVSTDGLSRLIVGGAIWWRMASAVKA